MENRIKEAFPTYSDLRYAFKFFPQVTRVQHEMREQCHGRHAYGGSVHVNRVITVFFTIRDT